MDLKSRLLTYLSHLQNTETVNQRQALLTITGFDKLRNQIRWEGDSISFFNNLLLVLGRLGQAEMVKFLENLENSLWISPEGRRPLDDLRLEVASLEADEWDRLFSAVEVDLQEVIERFQKATAQEIRIVGTKYIPELYFPRLRAEANFRQFLDSQATCFLVVAKAGRGKTNLMCRIVDEWQSERPVLFLSGRLEPRDSYGILRHVATRLGYGENWSSCLSELEVVANQFIAPLILIDGINESAAATSLMQDALRELLIQASIHRVKVCVTCRVDFWKFYRASFWREYVWSESSSRSESRAPRGEDLPLFPEEDFSDILSHYLGYFRVHGKLEGEAWERCRHPLLLRFFCEAYRDRDVGPVRQIRLYPLFNLFWERKIGNIQDISGLPEPYSINNLVLTIARLMYELHQTKVPRERIAQLVDLNLLQPNSLYFRVLDEEIIIEEEVDDLLGTRNVIFVYDKFSEYAIALDIFARQGWIGQSAAAIVDQARLLMDEEERHHFATLRGSLEFLVLHLEDRRQAEGIHFEMIKAMLEYDWKWRRIGSMLAFQLTSRDSAAFWEFMDALVMDARDFVRRICAEQLGQLAKYHPDQALRLLNRSLLDRNDAVRQTARVSLLDLDPSTAIQEAQLLIHNRPIGESSSSFAAKVLLSPMDSRSIVLQEKARWLVKENRDPAISQAILDELSMWDSSYFDGLFRLEKLERVFRVDWTRDQQPGNDYLDHLRQLMTPMQAALAIDIQRLESLQTTTRQVLELAIQTLGMRRYSASAVLKTPLDLLIPDRRTRGVFLNHAQNYLNVQLDEWFMEAERTLQELAFGIAASSPAFMAETELLQEVEPFDLSDEDLARLCQIADQLTREFARLAGETSGQVTLSTELGMEDGRLSPEQRSALRNFAAAMIGVEPQVIGGQAFASLGLLGLWLWKTEQALGGREKALEERVLHFVGQSFDSLHRHFSIYEVVTLSEQARQDLALDVQSLCQISREKGFGFIVNALTPLILWSSENDSPELSLAFQGMYWRDRDSFWEAAEALLEHDEQPVIDFASQLLEQAEYREEQTFSPDVFGRLKGIIVDLLAVEEASLTPDARFREDLYADSLDLVELIMAVEDDFDGEISDEDAQAITTVGELAHYISTRMR
ncbi:MAG: acyl carrier protein [Anaerolineales bacterium]|nr:acyl carrier protein [Anaerolineales bacterium]